jgi:hypothetical protein
MCLADTVLPALLVIRKRTYRQVLVRRKFFPRLVDTYLLGNPLEN